MSVKVHGWAADSAGCQAYRIRWVADAVNRHFGDEIEYQYGSVMSPESREWAETVIGQRVCLPGPSHYWQQWAKEGKKRLIMDADDDLFSVDPANVKASAVFNRGEYQQRLRDNFRVAHLITVSTEPLRQAIHRNTGVPLSKIVVISNALPPELVLDKIPDAESDAAPLLGWLASPTHSSDARMVTRHLKRFMEQHPGERFHSIGADYGGWMKLPESQRVHTAWLKKPEDAIRAIDYRVGICPLLPAVFNKSKSDCKWLELSARGVPAVVSDVSAYDSVKHGVTGYKVRYEHEWGKVLTKVTGDAEMRRELATAAHAYVKAERTTDNTAAAWKAAILGE